MSAREWKPGDVAVITQRHDPIDRRGGSWRASKDDKGWASLDPSIGWLPDGDVADARPLLVIDPEDREQVEQIAKALRDGDRNLSATSIPAVQAALRSLLAPPKPDEPQGLGAVVRDDEGYAWIRRGPTHYVAAEGSPADLYNASRTWGEIDAVEVLSEGVQP